MAEENVFTGICLSTGGLSWEEGGQPWEGVCMERICLGVGDLPLERGCQPWEGGKSFLGGRGLPYDREGGLSLEGGV